MSLPPPPAPGRYSQPISDDHLRALGSIVTALGHLEFALLRTVRDLVPGADRQSVEALLAGDSTAQLSAKFDRLVHRHHPDEAIYARVVSWSVATREVLDRWEEELRASWHEDQPDGPLRRVRYTRTAARGGLPEEETTLASLLGLADEIGDRLSELDAMRSALHLRDDAAVTPPGSASTPR